MIFFIFLILPCLVLSAPTECSGVTCLMYCEFGFVKDKNNCEICKCLPNPCTVTTCPKSTSCKPIPSPESCEGCDPFTAICESLLEICNSKPCEIRCMYGLKYDSNGCQLCECLPNPCTHTLCPMDTKCVVVPNNQPCLGLNCDPFIGFCKPEPACKPVTCKLGCLYGFDRDEEGCEICKCNPDPCTNVKCPENQYCSTTKGGITECKCTKWRCMECASGNIKDKYGCRTCQCNDPCEKITCPRDKVCVRLDWIGNFEKRYSCFPLPKVTKCPNVICPASCRLIGTKVDENGCIYCDCLDYKKLIG